MSNQPHSHYDKYIKRLAMKPTPKIPFNKAQGESLDWEDRMDNMFPLEALRPSTKRLIKVFISQLIRSKQVEAKEGMLKMCGCLKCKVYRNVLIDSSKVYDKLDGLKKT